MKSSNKKMSSRKKKKRTISADELAEKAMRGEDLSEHIKGSGKMMPGIRRVNVDFTAEMLEELDETAKDLNVSRQAVIKMFVRQSLNECLLAKKERRSD